MSTDTAISDYLPKAPIDDEAKKYNQNLAGQGGVFNTVNLHLYHYAGNNPVKYVDPTGKWFLLDDFLFSILAKLHGEQEENIIKGMINSFLNSWKDPGKHAKLFFEYYSTLREWLYIRWGIDIEDPSFIYNFTDEYSLTIDADLNIVWKNRIISLRKFSFYFRKKQKPKNPDINIDLSKIQLPEKS